MAVSRAKTGENVTIVTGGTYTQTRWRAGISSVCGYAAGYLGSTDAGRPHHRNHGTTRSYYDSPIGTFTAGWTRAREDSPVIHAMKDP